MFQLTPRFLKKTQELAETLTKENFKLVNKVTVYYKGKAHLYKLNIADVTAYKNCSCNCSIYMKDGICMHLVGYSWIYNRNLYGNYSNLPTVFATQTKKGRHRKTQKAGNFN